MEWIIRSRKDTGIVVEIMALGSSPCAPHVSVKMRQGFAGQNCHSRALKRERSDFPLSSHKSGFLANNMSPGFLFQPFSYYNAAVQQQKMAMKFRARADA